jgi:hypothetical protein
VPNCLLKRDNHEFWAYDRNNWQESDLSLLKQQNIPENRIITRGKGKNNNNRALIKVWLILDDNSDIFIGRHLVKWKIIFCNTRINFFNS